MELTELVGHIADALKDFDSEKPIHKTFLPGIGPFGEPQIVGAIAKRLCSKGIAAKTKRTPDLGIGKEWAIEFKIVRPFGNNGLEAENWSVNLLHPYPGNTSLLGDAIKLTQLTTFQRKGLFVIAFEHAPPKINIDPLLQAFELVATQVMGVRLGKRVEEQREALVHPQHQVLRCIGWELKKGISSTFDPQATGLIQEETGNPASNL